MLVKLELHVLINLDWQIDFFEVDLSVKMNYLSFIAFILDTKVSNTQTLNCKCFSSSPAWLHETVKRIWFFKIGFFFVQFYEWMVCLFPPLTI